MEGVWRSLIREAISPRLLSCLPCRKVLPSQPLRMAATLLAACLAIVSLCTAQEKAPDLTAKSIEDLMSMEVTSVSKKEQKVSRTAAAIYVITQEDIRRSGMTSVAELLRLVPGMDVAQINANNWAISSRGFNKRFADTLLVLIDGRSLYSPDFAGVFWQVQQLMLEDIERIEVIRGPGAAVWGANAVSGVINILTKKAKDTQKGLVSGGAGTQERGFAGVRYGGSDGDKLAYRVYGNYFDRGEFQTATGQGAGDHWQGVRGGFRTDFQFSGHDKLTVEGDAYNMSTQGQTNIATFAPPFAGEPFTTTTYTGGDLDGRWTHTYSPKSEFSFQMYYSGLSRDDILSSSYQTIADAAFQDRFALGERQDIIWGAEYRFTSDPTHPTSFLSFAPRDLDTDLGSVFIQDEIAVLPNRLWFTAGIELEDAPFSGFNVEPSGRLLWEVSENQSLWISAAQANRSPQRSERGLHDIAQVFPGPGGSLTSIDVFGSSAADNETYLDFEVGYRAQVTPTLSADLTSFYEHYNDLSTQEQGLPFSSNVPVPHTVIPFFYANGMHGHGYGAELSLSWKPLSRLKVKGGYSFLGQTLRSNPGSNDTTSSQEEGDNPRHQFQLRSQLDLPGKTEFDTSIYYVGKLVDQSVPAYTRLDLRLGWHPRKSLDFDLIGQNLLDPRHLEFLNNTGLVPSYSTRRVFARLTWRISH